MHPGSDAQGNVLAPTAVKRRAAKAIKSLHEQHQNDLQARLRLQAENAELLALSGPSLQYCKEEHRITLNKEQEDAFC